MKQKVTKTINHLNLFSALVLTSATILSFSNALRIILFVFFFTYLIEFFLEKKWTGIHFDKKKIYFLIVLFFFALAPISGLFDDTPIYVKSLLERRYSLLGFSIIGIFGFNDKFKIKYFFNAIVIASFVAIIYLIFYRIGLNEFISNPLRSKLFNETRTIYVNGHMMFNFYLNISLISIWYIFSNYWKKLSWWKLSLYLPVSVLFLYILFISEGRSGFTEACILLFSFIFIKVWKLKKRRIAITLVILIPLVLLGIFSHHQRMSKKELTTEPRLFLWQSALSVIKEKPIFGYGISNAQEEFDVARTKYQTEEFRIWSQSLKNKILDSHNQYLQTTMEFGIVGLILLLIIYGFPLFLVDKNRRILTFLFVFLCSYHSIFDMFITGQFGTIYFLLIVLLLQTKDGLAKKIAE